MEITVIPITVKAIEIVTRKLGKTLGQLDVKRGAEIIQITAQLKSATIFKSGLETCGDMLLIKMIY